MISCIIPMYNAQARIEACILSVAKQSYSDLEIIVIDDGSTDDSARIVSQLAKKESRIRLIRSENKGVSAARNLGLSQVKGEYVSFLDADDMLPPDAFAVLMEDLSSYQADIAVGKDISFTDRGSVFSSVFSDQVTVWNGREALEACLKDYPNTWNVCGKLFSRRIVSDIWFCEGRKIGEDSWFFFQCCQKEPVVSYRDQCVYNVCLSENSATRSPMSKSKIEDILFFSNAKISETEKCFPQYMPLAINLKINACLLILNNLCKMRYKELRISEKEIAGFIRKNKEFYIPKYSSKRMLFNAVIGRWLWCYKIILRFKAKMKAKIR